MQDPKKVRLRRNLDYYFKEIAKNYYIVVVFPYESDFFLELCDILKKRSIIIHSFYYIKEKPSIIYSYFINY
jgi:hypothetical protein